MNLQSSNQCFDRLDGPSERPCGHILELTTRYSPNGRCFRAIRLPSDQPTEAGVAGTPHALAPGTASAVGEVKSGPVMLTDGRNVGESRSPILSPG